MAANSSRVRHESFYNVAYLCTECYVLRQTVNGGCAFVVANGCRRLLYDRARWDASNNVALVRYGVRMMMYERLREAMAGQVGAPFLAGCAAELCGQAYTLPLQCAIVTWKKESVMRHLGQAVSTARNSALKVGIRFTAYELALSDEEAPSVWSMVNALKAGFVGGLAGSSFMLRTNLANVISSGVTFACGALLYEALAVAQGLPTTAMKNSVDFQK